MEKKVSTSKNAIYNTIGSCFYLACQWLITVIVIRLGSVENGGILTLAISVTNVFYTLSAIGRTYQVSDYIQKYRTGEYVSTRLFSCSFGFVLCLVYCLVFPGYSHYEIECIIAFMLFKAVEALSDEYQAIQQTAERMDYIFVSFVMRGILLLAAFSFLLYFTKSLLIALLGMATATGLVVLIYDIPVCRKLSGYHLEFSIKRSLRLLWDNIPLIINALFMVICVTIPRTQLNSQYGNYIMGVYGSISAPAAIIQNVAAWLFVPFIGQFTRFYNERDGRAFYRVHRRILLTMAVALCLILGLASLLGEWALNLVYGASIAEHADLLVPTLLATAMIAFEYYYSTLLTVTRELKYIVIANVAAVAATLAFSGLLINNCASMGVNYSLYISMGLNLLIQMGALLFILKKQFDTRLSSL